MSIAVCSTERKRVGGAHFFQKENEEEENAESHYFRALVIKESYFCSWKDYLVVI